MAMTPALSRLLSPLRDSPLQLTDQAVLALQIATWAFLGQGGKLPADLLPEQAAWDGERIEATFQSLRRLGSLGENVDAFATQPGSLSVVVDDAISHLVREAKQLAVSGQIGPELYSELLVALSSSGHHGYFALPQELVDLLVGLAWLTQGDNVYIPYDGALQLSLAAAQTGAEPFTELRIPSPLPYLANLLAGERITISAGDPIRHPAYTEGSTGGLRQFTHSICFSPLGERLPIELVERDRYQRFPERISSGQVLAVRHTMAQTTGRTVVLSANSLLFAAAAEYDLRRDLVERSLHTVIALPPAVLYGTAIPLSILVLEQRPALQGEDVLFIDGGNERFHKRDGKGRTTLQGWRELLDAVRTGDDPAAFRVLRSEIKANDYQLMVSRYARSDAVDAIEAAMQQGSVCALEELVQFIRPVPVIPSGSGAEGYIEVLEVGTGDLVEHDYISRPTKTARLAAVKNTLKPLDILISVKGSVGKVGLVPPGLQEAWVAGQNCLVLRMADAHEPKMSHTARSLFLYLRSALGKACLQRIFSGAAVPLIQLRELRRLPVMLPTLDEAHAAERIFDEVVEIQREIERLRSRQESLAGQCWPLPAGRAEDQQKSSPRTADSSTTTSNKDIDRV